MNSKTLFVDTHVLLHYRSIGEVDWPAIANTENVVIVVAPIVVEELDKHKATHPSKRLRKRAASVIRLFYKLSSASLEATLRNNVRVHFLAVEPLIDFRIHGLAPEVGDDRLIASILDYREQHPDATIGLVTDDLGLRLKSRRHTIDVLSLPESARLPEELDAQEKRIKELEEETRRLKDKIPSLKLCFDDGHDHRSFSLVRPDEEIELDIPRLVGEIKEKHPKIALRTGKALPVDVLSATIHARMGASPQEIAEYNRELEDFYSRYAQYWRDLATWSTMARRIIKLPLVIENDGNSPADDVDVFLDFPDEGYHVYNAETLPKEPSQPTGPAAPGLSRRLAGVFPPLDYSKLLLSVPKSPFAPTIRRKSPYEVHFHLERVKHKLPQPLDPLFVVFGSFEAARSFGIDYEIKAANIPEAIGGKLHLIVEKEEKTPSG